MLTDRTQKSNWILKLKTTRRWPGKACDVRTKCTAQNEKVRIKKQPTKSHTYSQANQKCKAKFWNNWSWNSTHL